MPTTGRARSSAAALDEELAHGRRLQRSFVSLEPPDVPGYDIASHYEAAREIGGDFFDLFRLRRRGRPLSIVIADVTGKGIAAALLMAFARPAPPRGHRPHDGPAGALERTNTHPRRANAASSLFITALVARLDLPTGRLRLANAGHEPPLLVPADGAPPSLVLGSGRCSGRSLTSTCRRVEWWPRGRATSCCLHGRRDRRPVAGRGALRRGRLFAAVERARGGSRPDVVDGHRRCRRTRSSRAPSRPTTSRSWPLPSGLPDR